MFVQPTWPAPSSAAHSACLAARADPPVKGQSVISKSRPITLYTAYQMPAMADTTSDSYRLDFYLSLVQLCNICCVWRTTT